MIQQERSWTTGREAAELLDVIASALRSRPPWWAAARCRGKSDLFFPEGRNAATLGAIKAARAICAACPVRSECLASGMAENHGVWAGTTERGRRILRTQQRRQQREAESESAA
jgi:WhiB family redox-sensing transcriptional regulator